MKKVLLATTALLMTAGAAAAEVTFNGNARFGLQYNSDPTVVPPGAAFDANMPVGTREATLEKRLRFQVNASTTTDGGVTLGAFLRHQSDEMGGNRGFSGARLYAAYNGLTVAVGNIEGAIESMPGLYWTAGMSLTGLSWSGLVTNTVAKGYFGWDAYSSTGNGPGGREGIEVKYTMGDFTVHASHSSNSLSGLAGKVERSAIYGAYKFSGWTVALGYSDSTLNTEDKLILLVGGNIGDYGVGFQVADNDGTTKIALNGSATFGATTVMAYVADEDTAGVDTAYGLGVSYNLGGGAKLVGGVESTPWNTTRADFGVSFSF